MNKRQRKKFHKALNCFEFIQGNTRYIISRYYFWLKHWKHDDKEKYKLAKRGEL